MTAPSSLGRNGGDDDDDGNDADDELPNFHHIIGRSEIIDECVISSFPGDILELVPYAGEENIAEVGNQHCTTRTSGSAVQCIEG